ncbi:MAG: ribonuclease HII [Clostridiales bacterium]|nr:ribonuclease HII [Clostridiales bacterium]
MTKDLFEFDLSYGADVAGCDEAGRGPIAGPVVVAACKMPTEFIVEGINDSKKLTPKKRELLYNRIISCAEYSIVAIDEKTIDEINILEATKLAMRKAISAIKSAQTVLIDAVKLDLDVHTEAIIKGDAKSYNIAAASILAKEYRDRLMLEMDKIYPEYGFAAHKGYGTKVHVEALKKYGPCPIHRRTFIKNFVGEGV